MQDDAKDSPELPNGQSEWRWKNTLAVVGWLLAGFWPAILLGSGVSSDTVHFAPLTKVVLVAGSLLLPLFLATYIKGAGWGCAFSLALYTLGCALSVIVILFWN
jgi:hypothetical protein